MEATVERIEKNMLILELDDKTKVEFPKKFFSDAKEGDVISFYIDREKTKNKKEELTTRMNRLWKD